MKRDNLLQSGEVILRLDDPDNHEENLVLAADAYARRSFLPIAKQYMDDDLREASVLKVVRRIFAASQARHGHYEFFQRHYLEPILQASPAVRRDSATLDQLDSSGLYNHVFIRAVRQLGDDLFPSLPQARYADDIRDFALHLLEIAEKPESDETPLEFPGRVLRSAVILVARRGRLSREGTAPYIRRIETDVALRYSPIFICGAGPDHIPAVRSIVRAARRQRILDTGEIYEFPMRTEGAHIARGIVAVCAANTDFFRELDERSLRVHEAFARFVPEVATGQIELASVSRIPGVGSKVAVRYADSDRDPRGAAGACIGVAGARASRIRRDIGGGSEWMTILPWNDVVEDFALEALGVEPDEADVEYDEDKSVVIVAPKDATVAARAIGSKGDNVRMASDLISVRIQVENPSLASPAA